MILVFGKTGQVARALRKRLPDAIVLGRDRVDLIEPGKCASHILEIKPEAVINAAAYTAVDQAETEEFLATTVNGDAPMSMARAAAVLNIPFVHISTDYVFDGSGEIPFLSGDLTNPLGAYGRSKLAGELGVRAAGGPHIILRTSWVFSSHGANFVKTMLRLGAERDALNIVADQIGGPTPADEIAVACVSIARQLAQDPAKSGTYHFAGAPDVSWAGFAREIFARAGIACTVTDIASLQYPTPALRPANSRLDCAETSRVFGLARPNWREGLARVLTEIKAQKT
jgi:dTDP-4-dehydrorhamnose reductase